MLYIGYAEFKLSVMNKRKNTDKRDEKAVTPSRLRNMCHRKLAFDEFGDMVLYMSSVGHGLIDRIGEEWEPCYDRMVWRSYFRDCEHSESDCCCEAVSGTWEEYNGLSFKRYLIIRNSVNGEVLLLCPDCRKRFWALKLRWKERRNGEITRSGSVSSSVSYKRPQKKKKPNIVAETMEKSVFFEDYGPDDLDKLPY